MVEDPIFVAEVSGKSNFGGEESFLFTFDKLDDGLGRGEVIKLIEHARYMTDSLKAAANKGIEDGLNMRTVASRLDRAEKWSNYLSKIDTYLESL